VEHAQNGVSHFGNQHRRRATDLNPAYKPHVNLTFPSVAERVFTPFPPGFHTSGQQERDTFSLTHGPWAGVRAILNIPDIPGYFRLGAHLSTFNPVRRLGPLNGG